MAQATARHDELTTTPAWRSRWPVMLGVLVAAGTLYGLTDGREVAAVVAASGLVYLAAAALGEPRMAWPAFGVTFVLIGAGKVSGADPVPWMLALAGAMVVVGLGRGARQPDWGLPLQTAAMAVLGLIAVLALRADPTLGGLLVAAALLGHATWDVYHYRAGRVVSGSLATFCGVLDVIVAIGVAVIALTG